MTALGLWTADFRSGEVAPDEIAREVFDAGKRVSRAEPSDPSLRTAQKYLGAMFNEYGEAISLHARGEGAGERMYRAYGLANFARDVLVEAQPELLSRGCDVGPLL
ncbi:MAG TPA: hypothetical protein VML54_02935 [Candidatus Limnocylindrales bacterium]|nr:hypothetical protein [Candidatus Limnocylindrales bacterium]